MKYIALFLLSLFTLSCSENRLNSLQWLQGDWTRTYGVTTNQLKWTYDKDTLLCVSSFRTTGDADIMQTTKIYNGPNGLELQLSSPDNPFPLKYTLLAQEGKMVQFRNVQPYFPEIITYTLMEDTLSLRLSGKTQGMNNQVEFAFAKASSNP